MKPSGFGKLFRMIERMPSQKMLGSVMDLWQLAYVSQIISVDFARKSPTVLKPKQLHSCLG